MAVYTAVTCLDRDLRVISIPELLDEFDDVRLCCLTKNARHGEHLFVLGVVDDAQQAHLHIPVAVPIWGACHTGVDVFSAPK